jgi:hypothetical protein
MNERTSPLGGVIVFTVYSLDGKLRLKVKAVNLDDEVKELGDCPVPGCDNVSCIFLIYLTYLTTLKIPLNVSLSTTGYVTVLGMDRFSMLCLRDAQHHKFSPVWRVVRLSIGF